MRDLPAGIHPGLETLIDTGTKSSLLLLSRYVAPTEIRRVGTSGGSCLSPAQRRSCRDRGHPAAALIRSLPGTRATLCAKSIAQVGNVRRFPAA